VFDRQAAKDFGYLLGPSVAYLVVLAAFLYVPWGRDGTYRIIGGVLQIAAVLDIVRSVVDTRRLLQPERFTALRHVEAVVRRIVRHGKGATVKITSVSGVGAVGLAAAARVRRPDESDLSIEGRLDYHQRVLKDLDAALDQARTNLEVERRERADADTSIGNELRESINNVDQLYRQLATGGLRMRLVSVFALVGGIAMQTFAPELADLFS
jgi:hypothetical protein